MQGPASCLSLLLRRAAVDKYLSELSKIIVAHVDRGRLAASDNATSALFTVGVN